MNTNDYLALNFKDIGGIEDFYASNRRDFLKRVGGGIVIFVALNDVAVRPGGSRRGPAAAGPDCLRISTPSCASARMAA